MHDGVQVVQGRGGRRCGDRRGADQGHDAEDDDEFPQWPGQYDPLSWPPPVSITKDNVDTVIKAGEVTRGDVCTGTYAKYCTEAGI